jgi:RNA polymerase sigma factor (sigma-70 family)
MPLGPLLRQLHLLTEQTDGQLLHRFADQRDEAAFAELVRRHGPLVWKVCGQVLRHEQDAEDAFQAAFLVLACKADSVRKPESLADWLYGVAYRTAMKARTEAARRRARDRKALPANSAEPAAEVDGRELLALLHEEIQRLPAKYRTPFVLCCLDGKSRSQAARQLGWKDGTVAGRLAEARQLLQRRLTRRGITLAVGPLAAALAEGQAPAAVPAVLAGNTIRAALLFAAGAAAPAGVLSARAVAVANKVLQALLIVKCKTGAALLLALTALAAGAGLTASLPAFSRMGVHGDEPKAAAAPPRVRPAAVDASAKRQADGARTDRYGDPLPPGALKRLGTVRFRHGLQIGALAQSPDGQLLASGGMGAAIRLWDATSGKPVGTLNGHKMHVFSLMFSADGKRLVSAGGGAREPGREPGELIVWDLAARKPRFTVEHGGWVRCATFSQDGRRVAMGCDDGTLLVLDAASGKELHCLRTPALGRNVNAVAFSPDGRVLAAGGSSVVVGNKTISSIRLWDAATGAERPGPEVEGMARALAFSPDGKVLASAQDGAQFQGDAVLHLWDLAKRSRLHTLKGHHGQMAFSLSFSPDGKRLASGGMDGTVLLWDAETGRQYRKIQSGDGWFHAVAFSPDRRSLIAGSTNGRIQTWDVASGQERFVFDGHAAGVARVALSPDGKTVATASADRTVRLWDLAAARTTRVLRGFDKGVYHVDFAPDGKRLVTSGGDGSVRLWDVASGTEARRLSAPGSSWHSQAGYSPSGKMIATANVSRIRLWDASTAKELREFKGHNGYVALTFSPDERLLASVAHSYGGNDGFHEDWTVRLWDVASGRELHRFGLLYPQTPSFTPDSRSLYCLGQAEGQARLHGWDALTGRERAGVPETDVTAYAFSPDGQWLATAHRGGVIRVREPAAGRDVVCFQTGSADVSQLIWAADGKTLLSSVNDATVLVWDLAPPGWEREPLERAWEDLGDADPARAYRAVWRLAAAGDAAVALLGKHVRPAPAKDAGRIRRLIADLDSDQFDAREAASQALARLGPAAEPALRRTLAEGPSPEVRSRVLALLVKLGRRAGQPSTADRRLGQAVGALERIGTAEARRLLQALSEGAPEAELTQQARAALTRLSRR